MELDTKQKVLIAIYTEYQKDIPDMFNNIKPEMLGISWKVFSIALEKLTNEGLITGVGFTYGGRDPAPISAWWSSVKMTRDGINYVETKLSIEPTLSAGEKVKELGKRSVEWGWEQFKDISSKVLSEILISQTS